MKANKLLLLCCLFWLTIGTLQAQDIHFSLFNMSPLTMNPAHTGAFYGTARIGGIYRDQWNTIPGARGFRTPAFYVDAPIFRGFGDNDWIGVGGSMFSDKAGTADLSTTAFMLSGAYHLGLGKEGNTVLTLGVQGGTTQRRLDLQSTELIFEDELDMDVGGGGLGAGAGADREMEANENYFDLNVGLMLRSRLNDQTNFELGVAGGHILQPEYNLLSSGTDEQRRRPLRITAHGALNYDFTDKWRFSPTFLFQTTQGATETMLQVWGGYLINPEKAVRLNFGTGYRLGDAVPILLGIDVGDLKVALAYDINTSSLSAATSSVGGFEIAASYIIKIFKEPDVTPAILCPEF